MQNIITTAANITAARAAKITKAEEKNLAELAELQNELADMQTLAEGCTGDIPAALMRDIEKAARKIEKREARARKFEADRAAKEAAREAREEARALERAERQARARKEAAAVSYANSYTARAASLAYFAAHKGTRYGVREAELINESRENHRPAIRITTAPDGKPRRALDYALEAMNLDPLAVATWKQTITNGGRIVLTAFLKGFINRMSPEERDKRIKAENERRERAALAMLEEPAW